MKLSEQEANEFFNLMWGLQTFVCKEMCQDLQISSVEEYAWLSKDDKLGVRNVLFENPELIDSYVQQNPLGLQQADLEVVTSWQHFVAGDFYIERLLKKYAVFIQGDQVYGVLALHDPFDEFFDPSVLPLYVRTILLPFKGRIIYDGLLEYYSVLFGRNISGELKEAYMTAKQNRRIITTLGDSRYEELTPPPVELPDWTSEIDQLITIAKRLRSPKDAPPIWSPTFSVLRASIGMTEKAIHNPDDVDELWDASDKVERALNRAQTVLYRSER